MSSTPLPISIQIYSLRNAGDLDRQLDIVRDAGFDQVELTGGQLEDAVATREKLDARGLVASSAHVGLAALRERRHATAQACRELGITRLYMPAVPAAERDSPAAYWTALGRELAGHAHALAGSGIRLGYHNHDWELKTQDGGRTALDLIFAGAGDDPLDWQVDVAWLVRGGADPLVLLRRHGGRVSSAHAKDLAPAGQKLDEDGWADVGHGTLDWPTLAAACRRAGARCLVAEHDNPSDPARFARNARRFLSKLQG
jgi:sugar phosphate isomerase/epimerase